MTTDINHLETLKSNLRQWTLILGVLEIIAGCLVGFIPPEKVAWFRGIVMAHIEFTANGVLMIVLGLLLREMRLGAIALRVWFMTLLVGTCCNGTAGVIAAFTGASSKLMSTINEKFPPPHGDGNQFATMSLMVCGVSILIALLLTLTGLVRARRGGDGGRGEPQVLR
jgi:uncharacterized membrane protein HdeD (DUF308 family)